MRRQTYALLVLLGCGGSSALSHSELRQLPEGRALQVVREACADAEVPSGDSFTAPFPPNDVHVDLRIGADDAPRFGVEWVSAQDREDGVEFDLPPGDQLRIVVSASGVQVLVLDARSYRFTEGRQGVQAGAAGATDVDARIRRDVRDFLVYAGLSEGGRS